MIKQCFQRDEDPDEKFGKKTGRKTYADHRNTIILRE